MTGLPQYLQRAIDYVLQDLEQMTLEEVLTVMDVGIQLAVASSAEARRRRTSSLP